MVAELANTWTQGWRPRSVQERVLDRGKSGGRADDNEETVIKRIKTCASISSFLWRRALHYNHPGAVALAGPREIHGLHVTCSAVI